MKVLVVVDMQNDFVTGPLGTKEAVEIIPNIKERIEKYKNDYSLILFTRDTHYSDYLDTLEGKKLPIKHCLYETPGWCIVDELYPFSHSDRIVNKLTFGSTELPDRILDWGRDIGERKLESIELCGVCTDICVVSNALLLRANYTQTPIIVHADCCAGTTPEMHAKALDVMRSCQITVI